MNAHGPGTFLIAVEKLSRIVIAVFLGDRSSDAAMRALVEEMRHFTVPTARFDRVPENAHCKVIAKAFGTRVAFYRPQTPREKAQVEERIKRIREVTGDETGLNGQDDDDAMKLWELDELVFD